MRSFEISTAIRLRSSFMSFSSAFSLSRTSTFWRAGMAGFSKKSRSSALPSQVARKSVNWASMAAVSSEAAVTTSAKAWA
jgi:hypothetical protein